MKFTITRDNLQQGLAAVGASVPVRTTLPVLSNILLEADADGVRMSGTDLDIAVSVAVAAEVEEAGALTVPARKFQELARELPEQPARVATTRDRLELTCGRATFRLNGLPQDEFPAFPAVDFTESWRVHGKVLHELIRHTTFAVSTEESRPILNGVLWQLGETDMRMVATNGHRLARMAVPVEGPASMRADLIVPPKALQQVERLFGAEDEIQVARSENHLGFQHGRTRVFTRLIEGPYPPYEQVIPKDNDKVAIVQRDLFTAALRRMAVVASEQTHRVRLSFGGPLLRLRVETPDLGEAQDELEVDYQGDALDIGFNASYLLEVLRYMPTEEVRLSFRAPDRAALIEPLGPEGEVPDYLCLVMPLRLLD
ncbi:MAG TPA: DNA polymerase III subunit beta [Longimicrobiales bacterium]